MSLLFSLVLILLNSAILLGAWQLIRPKIQEIARGQLRYIAATHQPATPWIAGGILGVLTLIPASLAVWALDFVPLLGSLTTSGTALAAAIGVGAGTVEGLRREQLPELRDGTPPDSRGV